MELCRCRRLLLLLLLLLLFWGSGHDKKVVSLLCFESFLASMYRLLLPGFSLVKVIVCQTKWSLLLLDDQRHLCSLAARICIAECSIVSQGKSGFVMMVVTLLLSRKRGDQRKLVWLVVSLEL